MIQSYAASKWHVVPCPMRSLSCTIWQTPRRGGVLAGRIASVSTLGLYRFGDHLARESPGSYYYATRAACVELRTL